MRSYFQIAWRTILMEVCHYMNDFLKEDDGFTIEEQLAVAHAIQQTFEMGPDYGECDKTDEIDQVSYDELLKKLLFTIL